MKKGILILTLLILALFSVSCIYAADTNDALATSEDAAAIEVAQSDKIDEITASDESQAVQQSDDDEAENAENDLDVLSDGTGNWSELHGEIDFGSNVVYRENFYDYFDHAGQLLDSVAYDELIFEGDFSDVGVNYISINKPIRLTGDYAVFNGVSFMIESDDVTVDGFSVTQSDLFLFAVGGKTNVTLSNNHLNFATLEGYEGNAVYAECVSNFNFINNTLIFTGNTDGTVVNNALRITGDEDNEIPSHDILVEGNVFDIRIPSSEVYLDQNSFEFITLSEGIVFFYCQDVKFVENRVNLRYTAVLGNYDGIQVVSFKGNPNNYPIFCSDVAVSNNNITAEGHGQIYGVYMSASHFEITGNNLNVSSDGNEAMGIYIDGPAVINGDVSVNEITVSAPHIAYAIYSYLYYGNVENVTYEDNVLAVDSYVAGGMDLTEGNPHVYKNTITATGNYTCGIVARADEGVIRQNRISASASNVGTDLISGNTLPSNSTGIIVKGVMSVEGNIVDSTNIGITASEANLTLNNNTVRVGGDYAIVLQESNAIITNNHLVAKKGTGNGAIIGDKIIYASGNTPLQVLLIATDLTKVYGDAQQFTVQIIDENQEVLANKTITLSVGGANMTNVTDENGVVRFDVDWDSGNYTVISSFAGDETYMPNSTENKIVVNKANSTLYLSDVTLDYGSSTNVTVTSEGATGITAKIDSENATVDGYNIIIPILNVGNYTLTVTTIADANHIATTKTAKITVNMINAQLAADSITAIYNIASDLEITLKDSRGNPLANQVLLVDFNGAKTFDLTDLNGTIKVPIIGLAANTYVVKILFMGNGIYSGSNASATVTVNKDSPSLSADAFTITYNVNKELVATLRDSQGIPIKGVSISVDLNGVKTFTTDANGQIKVAIGSLAPKTYTARITFNGNGNYLKSAKDVKVTVTKATPKLTANAKTFKKSVKTKKYSITLKDNRNKAISKAVVTIKINGKTYKAKTNAKGVATFKIKKLTKKGRYTATVTFKGNTYYNKVTKKVKIVVK